MKKSLVIAAVSALFFAISCQSGKTDKEETKIIEQLGDEVVNTPELRGRWVIETEQRYFERDHKVVETKEVETVPEDMAYVYDFKSDTLVTVSNLKNEFAWDFRILKQDSVLTLENINQDAEDDKLIYRFDKGELVLLRKMEDEDPENKPGVFHACFLLKMKKID